MTHRHTVACSRCYGFIHYFSSLLLWPLLFAIALCGYTVAVALYGLFERI